MIGNIDAVRRWSKRGVRVIYCNVWCRQSQGTEPQWIGDATTNRAYSRRAANAGRRENYFVGYRLRIRLKPEMFR